MRRVGSREWVVVVECLPNGVRVSPSRVNLSLVELSNGTGGALLRRTVEDLIARRRAAQLPDEPALRIVIRFQVHKDGTRTFHLAYPLLDLIDAEKRAVLSGE